MVRRIASALALSVSVLGAQSPFEGSIAMKMGGDGDKPIEVAYMVKGGKIRMEVPTGRGETMAMIMNMAERKVLILMAAQKMYMEQPMGAAVDSAAKDKAPTIKRTGKTETIAGYKCEHVTVTEANGAVTDVCTATGIGSFQMPSGGGRGGPPKAEAWESALGDAGFPLKVQKGDKVILEVTKLEKKTLDAALFSPPDGYTKFDMGGMMRKRP
jgi:hypothetical protein